MSLRSLFRRKIVLPVTIMRRNGQEKHLAHTLDLTETSARLGGVPSSLEPGEIIEIQRGAVKAKFQVFWMGALASTMEGQAGVRSLEPNKIIWGVSLAPDQTDLTIDGERLRNTLAPVRSSTQFPGEKRWSPRYLCSGGVSIKTASTTFAIHGEIKDLSRGGIYVELMTPLPVNTHVTLNLTIEGIGLELGGIVSTSYPLVGMGVCFSTLSSHDQEKIARMIKKARQTAAVAAAADALPARQTEIAPLAVLRLDMYSAPVLAKACETLAANLDDWKSLRSVEELAQVREAVSRLHEKLLQTAPPIELLDYFAATTSPSGRTH